MRRTLIVTHRWVALVTGLILFVTAVSGLTLVFEGVIDRTLHPSLWNVATTGPALPLDTLVARVEGSQPKLSITTVNPAAVPGRVSVLSSAGLTLFVNPYTGAVTGTRTPQQSQAILSRRLHVLHVELFAGPAGRSIVGAASAVALFLVITGMCIWWRDKLVRVHTGASWKRINFDLHHLLGIVASLVLVVITASGLVVHYDALGKAIKSLDTTPPPPPPVQAPPAAGETRRPSFDALAAAARAALPGAELMFVSLGTAKNPATAAMKFPEDHTPAGRSRVFLDRYSATVLATTSTRSAQLGTRLDNLKRSVHTGEVFGSATQAIWFLATLFLASQVVTGVLMWWNARRGREAARR